MGNVVERGKECETTGRIKMMAEVRGEERGCRSSQVFGRTGSSLLLLPPQAEGDNFHLPFHEKIIPTKLRNIRNKVLDTI